jgi:hypothetical protein
MNLESLNDPLTEAEAVILKIMINPWQAKSINRKSLVVREIILEFT